MSGGGWSKRTQTRKKNNTLAFIYSLKSHVSKIHGSVSFVRAMTSERVDSLASLVTIGEGTVNNHSLVSSRIRSPDDVYVDYDSGLDGMGLSSERAIHRVPLASFSKPAPSKWDDAQKWIASPTSNVSKIEPVAQGVGSQKPGHFGLSNQPPIKVVVEVPDQRLVTNEEPDTKGIDWSHATIGNGGQKSVSWEADPYPSESFSKPVLMTENRVKESINLNRHDSSVSIHGATAFIPPPTARSVSMRDMGTEMTPLASQEPSRTGTPVTATTPTLSRTPSRPSSPGRAAGVVSPTDPQTDPLGSNRKELSEKELQMKTRREIMNLGTKLGKMNIAAWAGKENEDKDASSSRNALRSEQPAKSVVEIRAAAWEEAEKAKYMARFNREEINIQAWEDHQKAKTEAEIRKIEVEVERIRARAQDKLMNKLATVRLKAEEKLAAAEAKRNCHAAKTEEQADVHS
ncbi:Remorin family protein [Abeliophyllum distichum]|uniref:Remorin family protein n=1 Tax=Abeliophyllum distichum TaxID=126358 RepID=A0ABD1U1B8_9LAMI